MKNFLVSLIVAVIFILPNVAQADTLDDFKSVLASKHFLIKYSFQGDFNIDGYSTKRDKGEFYKDKDGEHVTSNSAFMDSSNIIFVFLEAYDGNNFYTERSFKINGEVPKKSKEALQMYEKMGAAQCQLKIGNKLFDLNKIQGKYRSSYVQGADLPYDFLEQYAIYEEIDENAEMGQLQLRTAINALFNQKSNIDLEKYIYQRTGNGTDSDGFEYFDLKAETSNANQLNAIRYYFKDGVIKKIAIAGYYKNPETGQSSFGREIITVEEFNNKPDSKYFKLPKNFKWQKSVNEIARS